MDLSPWVSHLCCLLHWYEKPSNKIVLLPTKWYLWIHFSHLSASLWHIITWASLRGCWFIRHCACFDYQFVNRRRRLNGLHAKHLVGRGRVLNVLHSILTAYWMFPSLFSVDMESFVYFTQYSLNSLCGPNLQDILKVGIFALIIKSPRHPYIFSFLRIYAIIIYSAWFCFHDACSGSDSSTVDFLH